MADVTGTIGNEHVELNNAATEATLKLLLAAITGGNAKAAENIKSIATKAGLDPATVSKANDGLKNSAVAGEKSTGVFNRVAATGASAADGLTKLGTSLSPLIDKLLAGTAQASDAFGALDKLPGVLGTVMGLFGKVASYQQDNMKSYQQITAAGANLGGSLTDLRQAALNSYMTLDQFSNLIKNNSDAFTRMGGTVNDGVKAFASFSNGLIKSETGSQLLALGYTTEQLNNGMATYIAATGGRNRAEMADREKLALGAKNYFEQLDALTTITGISKEEQEKAMKERAANEAWQAHLLTLSADERAKAEAAAAEARARGGKGAEQALMSAAMGFPPMTKAAQEYTAVARNGAAATTNLVKDIKDSSKTVKDVQRDGAAITAGLAKDGRDNAQVFKALVMQGGDLAQTAGQALGAANKTQNQGIKDATDARAQLEQVQQEQRKRQADSQAKQMAETDKAFKEIGQAINDLLAPAIKWATEMISSMAKGLAFIITGFNELSLGAKLLVAGITALVLWKSKELIAEKMAAAKDKAASAISKAKGMVPGSSPLNPLYVVIVKGGAGGAGGGLEDLLDKGKDGKGGGTKPSSGGGGKLGKLAKGANMLKGGVGGLVGGLALDYAADKARESGNTKTAAGLDIGSSALSGAGMGAMMGSIVPGVGTVIGGAVGGLVGGAYGAYQNWGGLTGKKPMADGGIVDKPTNALVGEAGPEIVSPIKYFENLQTELVTLNKQTVEMLRFLKETAEHTRNTADATKGLGGDLFKF
jgi:hypothetical protein